VRPAPSLALVRLAVVHVYMGIVATAMCGTGCGGAGRVGADVGLGVESASEPRALREKGLRAPDDVTFHGIRGARVFPNEVGHAQAHGIDPDGGCRFLIDGFRGLSYPDGSMRVAEERFASTPTSIVPVPERLGGGFLYALDRRVWRSDVWLGKVTPIVSTSALVGRVLVGLDRLYLQTPQGGLVTLVSLPDGTWGLSRDLGPLPRGPNAGRVAAADAWHAVAALDLQGALVTSNAGATWRRVPLPIAPTDVKLVGDAIVVVGLDEGRRTEEWEVRPDGQTTRLASLEGAGLPRQDGPEDEKPSLLGASPLRTALEDGFPLSDGTALVLRDGSMARVRLDDGKVVETVLDAFPLKPARCHPFSLASPRDPGAFGYACGEPRGRTAVYRWDARSGRPIELHRFGGPREVLAFANGALAAHGPCATGPGNGSADEQTFCVKPPPTSREGAWYEVHFRGDEADRARLVVLSDGRVIVVRPPFHGDLSSARLAFVGDSRADGTSAPLPRRGQDLTEVALRMPELEASVVAVLREGIWRDGFEERRPGVLGGWVDDGDSVVGVEIALDGAVVVGERLHEAVTPIVAGRWGLAWTASKRGLETTDGGMTWHADIELPGPLSRAPAEVACGPLGCVAAGWLRVGWGRSEGRVVDDPKPWPRAASHGAPTLALECETASGLPPPDEAMNRAAVPPPSPFGRPIPMQWYMGPAAGPSAVLPALGAHKAPALPPGDTGISADVRASLDRTQRTAELARIYAWGPKSGEWDVAGRWQVLWQWPWGAWPDVRSTTETLAQWASVDAARQALGLGGLPLEWALEADDADHALLVGRRTYGGPRVDILALETNRAPVEVHRAGGEPFADVEGALRSGGHWYVATSQSAGEVPATVLWLLDGSSAREAARLPRLGLEPHAPMRLAGRDGGRMIGVVVDGQTSTDGEPVDRWVFPVDIETGAVGEAELLGAADLSDRQVTACTGDDPGWLVELPYPGTVTVRIGSFRSHLQAPFVRMRLSRDTACVTRVLGSVEPSAPQALTSGGGATQTNSSPSVGSPRGQHPIEASALSARMRYALRCIQL
jgi:hypothetical protein